MELAGAFIQPLRMCVRQTQINVVRLACVSWVSIPRGSENQSGGSSCAKAPVNLDKREHGCPLWTTYPQATVGCLRHARKFEKELENTNTNSLRAALIAGAGPLGPNVRKQDVRPFHHR